MCIRDRTWKTILRSSGIGSFIGVLPAEGGTVASLIGYSEAKRWSKKPQEFGKGSIEGIGFIPVVVGLFAISEMLTQSTLLDQVFKRVALKAVRLPSLKDYKLAWKTILRSSGIGSFIGVLPAEGLSLIHI